MGNRVYPVRKWLDAVVSSVARVTRLAQLMPGGSWRDRRHRDPDRVPDQGPASCWPLKMCCEALPACLCSVQGHHGGRQAELLQSAPLQAALCPLQLSLCLQRVFSVKVPGRMRKSLLGGSGVPQPQGLTFTFLETSHPYCKSGKVVTLQEP